MSNFDFLGKFLGKRANIGKDGHDVSSVEALSLPFGTDVPVGYRAVVPGEHYEGKVSGYVQTAPMREDNFASIYCNSRAVFVPLKSIMRNYLSITNAGRNDVRKDSVFNFFCRDIRINRSDLLLPIFCNYFIAEMGNYLLSKYPDMRLASHNGSNGWIVTQADGSTYSFFEKYSILEDKVLHYYNDALQQVYTALGSCRLSDAFENLKYYQTLSGHQLCYDALRLLDNLGFGNYIPAFQNMYHYIIQRGYSHVVNNRSFILLSNGTSQVKGNHFYWKLETTWLINSIWRYDDVNAPAKSVSLLPFIAYQFYISTCCRSNYRLPASFVLTADAIFNVFDSTNFDSNIFSQEGDVLYFNLNLDELLNTQNLMSNDIQGELIDLVRGSVLLPELTSDGLYFYLFGLSNPLLDSDLFTTMTTRVVQGQIPSSSTAELTSNIVQTIADKTALYKLRQDMLRAGVKRSKNFASIFGVNADDVLYEPCQILEFNQSNIEIQSLINQAETAEAPLGARSARGNGGIYYKFKFDSTEYGYLFFVSNFTTKVFYESFGIDRVHTLSPSSWWLPQFNHLGLEPIMSTYLSDQVNSSEDYDAGGYGVSTGIIGYSARNYELKQVTNKVHGLFTNFAFNTDFAEQSQYSKYLSPSLVRGNSIFGGYLPTVIDQQTQFFGDFLSLYFNPYMMNNIFVDLVDGITFDDFGRDYFRCVFNFKIHKVSPMPKLGLLKLNV